MIRALGLISVFLTLGCRETRVGDLRKEFTEPRYSRTIETSHHIIEIRYITPLQQLVERMGWEDSVTLRASTLDSLMRSEPKGGLLLAMTISPKTDSAGSGGTQDLIYGAAGGYSDYRKALDAFQFGLKDRIWIECGDGKIPLSQYHMENFFGMSRGRVFMLSFPALPRKHDEASASCAIVLDDLVPGLSRRRVHWDLPVGKYNEKI